MNFLPLILLVLSGLPQQTTSTVILTWNEAGPYTAFRVYRKPVTRPWYSQIAVGIKTTNYTDTVPSGEYNYEVRAVNNVSGTVYLSSPSDPITVQVP